MDEPLDEEFDDVACSCCNCGVDVTYDEDDGSGLCGQCQWWCAQMAGCNVAKSTPQADTGG